MLLTTARSTVTQIAPSDLPHASGPTLVLHSSWQSPPPQRYQHAQHAQRALFGRFDITAHGAAAGPAQPHVAYARRQPLASTLDSTRQRSRQRNHPFHGQSSGRGSERREAAERRAGSYPTTDTLYVARHAAKSRLSVVAYRPQSPLPLRKAIRPAVPREDGGQLHKKKTSSYATIQSVVLVHGIFYLADLHKFKIKFD